LVYPGNLTEYQYSLVEDKVSSWVDLNQENEATFKLDNAYIKELKIRSRKAGGYDWSKPLTINLEILQPWYNRKSSIIFFGLLGVAIFGILWRANNKQFQKKITHLESSLKEKDDLEAKDQNGQHLDFQVQEVNIENRMLEASIDLVSDVTEKIYEGMIWDHVLEHLSMAFLKLPHTSAFEIGILNKNTNKIMIEGYSHSKSGFYQRVENWSKIDSFYVAAIKTQKTECKRLDTSSKVDLYKWTGKFSTYIIAPFIQGSNRNAIICLYGNKMLHNKHILKSIKSVSNYLELIH
jgi:hypothetical protein